MDPPIVFKTFEELQNYINKLKREYYTPLRIETSIPAERYNQSVKDPSHHIPLELKYFKIMYCCKHYGKHKYRGRNIRRRSSVLACGCNYHLAFKYERHMKGFIITSKDDSHNHEVGPEIYPHYSENRRLGPEEKCQVIEMFRAGAKTSLLRELMEAKTSKVILNKDLHNIKKGVVKHSKLGVKGLTENKTVEIIETEDSHNTNQENKNIRPDVDGLTKLGQEFINDQPGSDFIIIMDENEHLLEMVFIQTLNQKKMYEAFGEMLHLDVTHRTSKLGMSLFDFIVEDSNGKSLVIGYCFVLNERKESISIMLNLFKQMNPLWESTKVILIDRNFVDSTPIKDSFKNAKILLCLFPMMKVISNKLIGIKTVPRKEVISTCKSIIYASTELELDSFLCKLKKQSTEFHKYFLDNWMSVKETWSKVYRQEVITLMSATTIKMEANHNIIKKHLSATRSLNGAIHLILLLSKTSSAEITHEEFKQKFHYSDPCNRHEDIKNYSSICTKYASELIAVEHDASLKKKYTILNENDQCCLISLYQRYTFEDQFMRCSCDFNTRMHLPCRHIFYVRRSVYLPAYDEDMVSQRFRKNYFADGIKQSNGNNVPDTDETLSYSCTNEIIQPMVKDENKTLTRYDKYKKVAVLTDKIAEAASALSDEEFHKTFGCLEIILQAVQRKDAVEVDET